MKSHYALFLAFVLFLAGCGKDRDTDNNNNNNNNHGAGWHKVYVNEIYSNATGNEPDWMELYNPGNTAVVADSGMWYVTDNLSDMQKCVLPGFTIPANGYIQIICDGTTGISGGLMHASFSLKSSGEQAGVSFMDTVFHVSDSLTFPETLPGTSYGRNPDGSETWNSFNTPTPGATNQ